MTAPIHPHHRKALVALNPATLAKLKKWGVTEHVCGRLVCPGDGSLEAAWLDWCARGCPTPGVEGRDRLSRYNQVRKSLKARALEHPEFIVIEAIRLFAPKRLTRRMLYALLGGPVEGALAIQDRILGQAIKRGGPRNAGKLDDLLAEFDDRSRDLLMTDLNREVLPPIQPPSPAHIARVLAIRPGPIRLLAATLLLASSSNRVTASTACNWVANCERYADVLPAGDERTPRKVSNALQKYLRGDLRPQDRDQARARACALYRSGISVAERHLIRVLRDSADPYLARLPALPADEDEFATESAAKLRDVKTPGRSGREDQAIDLVPRFAEVLVGVENRVIQLEWLVSRCLAALPGAEAALDSGLAVGFEDVREVIDEMGGIGVGQQRISFSFRREGDLLKRAYEAWPNETLARLLDGSIGGLGTPGKNHDPERWKRLHVVYEGTTALAGCDRAVEPWFVDLFRWGMLEPDHRLPGDVSEMRRRAIVAGGLPLAPPTSAGLLCNDQSRRAAVKFARTNDPARGAIVIPLINLYHAALYGRLILSYGLRWGARFGETTQLRLGPDCFRTHWIGGEEELYVALKPKGWLDYGKFGIDDGMIEAILQAKLFTHARWFPDTFNEKDEPWLPSVRFGDSARTDLPIAPYLFVGRDGMPPPGFLMHIVKVLTYGILTSTRHVDRMVFATMLGLDGLEYEKLGGLLHHRPQSRMPMLYDLSGRMLASGAARAFNDRVDMSRIGLVAGD